MSKENRSTYALLVGSEEKKRGIMETVLYALFGVSALFSIWQFVHQPIALPQDARPPATSIQAHVVERNVSA